MDTPFARYCAIAARCALAALRRPEDMRCEILELHNAGVRHAKIAAHLGCSVQDVSDQVSSARRAGAHVVNQRTAFGYYRESAPA